MKRQAEGDALLELVDVESAYGELRILHDAALRVRRHEVVALFGPNGHGKSTLLKAIAGIHPPRRGRILFDGEEITRLPSDRIVARGIAYIPEARNLFNEMTVLENLRLGAFNRRARRRIDANLELVLGMFPRLDERKEQLAGTLSGGESRMLAVGRGLMSDARLLLIDEPSIGLSPLMKKTVFSAILRIKRDTDISILVVEQEVDYPLAVADRIYLLKKGTVIFERPAAGIGKEEIEKAYF